jgi:hypothetical protein
LALQTQAKSYSVPDDGVDGQRVEKTLPGFIYNGPGLLITYLGGFIRNGRVSLRSEESHRANVRLRFNSSWNWANAADLCGRDIFWELTVEEYLREPCTSFKTLRRPTLDRSKISS